MLDRQTLNLLLAIGTPAARTCVLVLALVMANVVNWFAGVIRCDAAESSAMAAAVNSITQEDLKRHVEVLADDSFEGREAGSRGGQASSSYLRQHLTQFGLKPSGTDGGYFQYFGGRYRNVLGIHEGSDPDLKNEFILVGAHYDHVGYGNGATSYGPIGYIHNGADDNASGTAALLELIESFAKYQIPTRRSVIFVFWDGEEQGLLGSRHFVNQPAVPLDRIRLLVNMDMVGRLGRKPLIVYGTRTAYGSRQLLSRANTQRDLLMKFSWEIQDNSDHYPFFLRRVPILMLHTGLHDDYHRPSDDADKIDVAGMQRVVRLLFSLTHDLANVDNAPTFRSQSYNELSIRRPNTRASRPTKPPRLGVSWRDAHDSDDGLLVTRVVPASPADQAGLQVGDRIIQLGERDIRSSGDLQASVAASEGRVRLLVRRGNEAEASEMAEPLQMIVTLAGQPVRLGISWRVDDAEPGTIIATRIFPDGPAASAGLQPNDRIYEVAGRSFQDGDEFRSLVASQPFPLDLLVERRGRLETLTLVDSEAAGKDESGVEP